MKSIATLELKPEKLAKNNVAQLGQAGDAGNEEGRIQKDQCYCCQEGYECQYKSKMQEEMVLIVDAADESKEIQKLSLTMDESNGERGVLGKMTGSIELHEDGNLT